MFLIILYKYFLIKQKFALGQKRIPPAGSYIKGMETVAVQTHLGNLQKDITWFKCKRGKMLCKGEREKR